MASTAKIVLPSGAIRYEARYRDATNKSVSKRFKTRREAEDHLIASVHAVRSGHYVDPRAGRLTFQHYAEEWRATAIHSPNTQASVETRLRKHVYPHIGHRPIATITSPDLQRMVRALQNDLAPRTVDVVFRHVTTVFELAVANRILASSPCKAVKIPRPKTPPVAPISADTVHAIADCIGPRMRNLILVAAGTGLRQGELFGLRLSHVDFDNLTIRIDQQIQIHDGRPRPVPLKTEASYRTVPVTEGVLDAIRDQVDRYGLGPDGLIFTGRTGKPLRRNSMHDVFRPVVEELHLPPRQRMHALRHFYASMLIRGGSSVKVVQARLGHRTAQETLETYGHLWEDDDDRTRAIVDTILGAQLTKRNGEPGSA